MSNVTFQPVQGKESSILNLPIVEGRVDFAIDTGKIYVETDIARVPMGGAGAAIVYGNASNLEEDENTQAYHFPKTALEPKQSEPKVGDIILNSDGKFFRVLSVESGFFKCSLLAVSGSGEGGGGGGGGKTRPTLLLEELDTYNLINGQDAKVYLTATSASVNGVSLAKDINIKWTLTASGEATPYHNEQKTVQSGIRNVIDFGKYLRESTMTTVTLQASALNHEAESWIQSFNVTTSNLELQHISSFSPTNIYNPNNVVLSCNAIGNTAKILDFYFDGELVEHRQLAANAVSTQSYQVKAEKCSHGYHTVEIRLFQDLDGDYGLESNNRLKFEIPVVISGDSSQKPIIWLGDYKDVYYNYDSIQIPFLVYDPANTTQVTVHLYKNRIEQGTQTIKVFSAFSYWEIADAELNQQNFYQISCGEDENRKVEREISFKVEQDPNRSMTIVKTDNLKLNFDPAGRTNNESETRRAEWTYGTGDKQIKAQFTNFNWYNNGWGSWDEKLQQTSLRISNGAQFTIPYGALIFGNPDASMQSNSIEMQFKISNIQNYKNLITNITRYKIKRGESTISDETVYNNFLAQTKYDNYDAYLQATLTPEDYENLIFDKVQKNINLENVVMGFYDSLGANQVSGICVGPQDTFFSNGTNTVNVSFVENDMINLSFVYSHSLKLLFIYINGCITGVIKSDKNEFSIQSGNIVFNSKYCDIDLYKLRVYNTDLNVNDIVINYAVDRKDIDIYDQNSLATENLSLKEYQLQFEGDNGVKAYNEAHPNDPLMPYIIYDTTDFEDNRLPWSKAITRNIKVEFVNTPLERAYANGELETLAKKDGLVAESETDYDKIKEAIRIYYKHHCPSWTSTMKADDRVEIVVQGTSSEFYPRRNFKIKTKIKDVEIWDEDAKVKDEQGNETGEKGAFVEDNVLNIYMNKGPYEEIYTADTKKVIEDPKYYGHEESRMSDGWYMNNYTNGTDRWTMKVDYMESSGSYNAGFASLIGNGYTKHPLQDYISKGRVIGEDELKPVVSALSSIRWSDFRTSLLGFPVMAFQKKLDSNGQPIYLFVGYYRMLLDKGSDEVLGFKTPKKVYNNLFPDGIKDGKQQYKRMRDIAECWEYATNSRTFCSFKDPWERVQFSFKSPVGETNEFTANKAPMVMNHYEYRYHWAEDYLDDLFLYNTLSQEKLDKLMSDLREDLGKTEEELPNLVAYTDDGDDSDARAAQEVTLSFYKNWEEACAWVWSTNLDNVSAQGTYSTNPVPVGRVQYEANKYYILTQIDEDTTDYIIDTSASYTDGRTYYNEVTDEKLGKIYVNAYVAKPGYVYEKNKFYQKIAGTYSLVSDETFSDTIEYYEFTSYSDLDLGGYDENWNHVKTGKADLLIKPATGSFKADGPYFLFDGSQKVNPVAESGAVIKVETPVEADFNAGLYYEPNPVTYAGKTYKFDTQEYRSAKFINELTKHFDPEYLATYFVATEVFELYDSRGKNCMMASWGPHEPGGSYIWYPIFYDIDTQLGINNTGIPSFEFNVDATDAGNFSTSDSILWNNFYKFFKNSYILTKYQNLRGKDTPSWNKLTNPPLQSVDYLEKWYTFDPNTTNNIACRGKRPLIATNLDLYFKYITITNKEAVNQGVGYLLGEDGIMSIDNQGAYFYALQGDRSQSRRQFLTNRLEYIDSWLNQGNYARAGNNRIRGRISANNISGGEVEDVHSDKWVEGESADTSYWVDKEYGTKRHEFDSQYWLDLTPIRSSYVTAGDDSANYPSKKYDGANPVKFKLAELEQGIRKGANYPEQLLYIYGMNQMKDVGDLSKMYWTEFFMEGNFDKLTSLKLGHDGISTTDPNTNGGKWYNKKLNGITLAEKLPLLKEANFCNIGLSNETTLPLQHSYKLENFRATGTSKLVSVKFADGVALNTLYLPESVTDLTLVQANLLTDLITNADDAIPETENGKLIATPGLYLEGFFGNTFSSQINTINLDGGALGYNSYTLLKRFYDQRVGSKGTHISMTDVKWCPFIKMAEGDSIDYNYAYYRDNGHYMLDWYAVNPDTYDSLKFNAAILSGEMYKAGPYVEVADGDDFNERYIYFDKKKDKNFELVELTESTFTTAKTEKDLYYINRGSVVLDDAAYSMLMDLPVNLNFEGLSSNTKPNITGTIFIENNSPVEESHIRTVLQNYYPEVTFFFKDVTKAFSAKFIIYDDKTGSYEYVKFKNGVSSIPSIQKIKASDVTGGQTTRFASPFELYNPDKTHYDFLGWSNVPNPGENDILITPANDTWNTSDISLITKDDSGKWIYDYTYYAIFTIHEYTLSFFNHDGSELLDTIKIPYGQKAVAPTLIPYRDDSQLSLFQSYDFQGYSLAVNGSKIDVSTVTVSSDEEFYANFKLIEDIRTTVHPEWFKFTPYTYSEGAYITGSTYSISGYVVEPAVALQGKVVIPRSYKNQPVVALASFVTTPEFPHRITHVFMEKENDKNSVGTNPVTDIWSGAFLNMSSLKYFEFENSNLRHVGQNSFQNCALDASKMTLHYAPLKIVEYFGFNGGITSSEKTALIIPSSLMVAGPSAFSYLSCLKGTDLIIGSESELSKLNLAEGGASEVFVQNDDNAFGAVTFHSEVHNTNDEINGMAIQSFFGYNMNAFAVY